MAGKPVVDLLVGVRDLESVPQHMPSLERLGYENPGEILLSGRLYLRKRGPPDFNIAMTEQGGAFWNAQIILRDFLLTHPDEAIAYSSSKRALYADGARMFSSYSQGKERFLSALMERAGPWHTTTDAG